MEDSKSAFYLVFYAGECENDDGRIVCLCWVRREEGGDKFSGVLMIQTVLGYTSKNGENLFGYMVMNDGETERTMG